MNRWTIKKKLTVLITLALAVAVCFFILCYHIGKVAVHRQTMRGVDERVIESLNQYIRENDVETTDSEALMHWCRKIGEMDMVVFANEQLVFSSVFDMSKRDYTIVETGRDKELAVKVRFADADADVLFYKYRGLHGKMIFIEAMMALLLFYGIVVIGLRGEVDYIHLINEEIQALEGGDLSREITIKVCAQRRGGVHLLQGEGGLCGDPVRKRGQGLRRGQAGQHRVRIPHYKKIDGRDGRRVLHRGSGRRVYGNTAVFKGRKEPGDGALKALPAAIFAKYRWSAIIMKGV